MFAFKLWSRFGAFRDPITITQNITLPIPPKTAVGGIIAAILGLDYNECFTDEDYFSFGYSLILNSHIRKKSFAQNYVEDYTKNSTKIQNQIAKVIKNFTNDCKEEFKITRFQKPKPIFRELLIDPQYLIFINNFKYEAEITKLMKSHNSVFHLYMGNTEFAANYEYVPCSGEKYNFDVLDSFTAKPQNIVFESGIKYTKMYAATKTYGSRQYTDYKSIVVADDRISLKNKIEGYSIETNLGKYNCEFI